jgi:hypothetical protein
MINLVVDLSPGGKEKNATKVAENFDSVREVG